MSIVKLKIVLLLFLLMSGIEVYSQSYIYGLFGDKFRADVDSQLSGLGRFKFGGDLFVGVKRLEDGRFAIVAKGKLYQPTLHPSWYYVGNHHVFADVSGIPSASPRSTDNYYITASVRYGNLKLADREAEVIVRGNWNEDIHEVLYYCSDEENKMFKQFAPHTKLVAGEIDVNSVPISEMRAYLNKLKIEEEAKQTAAAEQLKNTNNSSSGSSPSRPVLSSASPSSIQVGKPTTASQNKTTVSSENVSSSTKRSNDIYDRAERAGKTLQQMEYEREAYQRQEQERLQQATNPGGYYMEKSGLNAYFDAQHERLNREAAEKEAREEREWLARKRREEREARDREREAEEWRKKVQNELMDRIEKRLSNYNAKGGDTNYRLRLNQWRSFAANEVKQINAYIHRYRGQSVTFTFPENNCHYVQAIENVQNSAMPNDYKDILIRNVLRIRYEYHRFYMDNAYISENWLTDGDDLYHSPTYAPCGNYLDIIALALNKGDVYKSYTYFQNGRGIGAMDDEPKIVDKTNTSGRNYSIPMGAYPLAVSFREDVKNAGLNIRERELSYLLQLDGRSDVMNYQEKPYNWSEGIGYRNMKEAPRGYADGINYTSKIIWNNPTAIQSEITKFNAVYDVKQKFHLNTVKEELMMTYFNYHTGNPTTSYRHFQRYLFWQYGGFYPFLEHLKHLNNQLKTFTEKDVQEFFIENGKNSAKSHLGIAFVSLLVEKGEYTHALELLNELDKKPSKFFTGIGAGTGLDSFRAGLQKLRNIIYFETGQYSKMVLPKDENEIKARRKKVDDMFKFVPNKVYNRDRVGDIKENQRLKKQLPIDKVRYLNHDDPHLQALALVQLGNKKLAKAVLEDMVGYYAKHNSKSPRVFLGSSTNIAAMKEAMHLLYPSQEDKIQYRLAGERLLHHYLDYAWNAHGDKLYGMGRYLLPHNLKAPTYISKETVDLETLQEWATLKTRLQSHDGSRNAIQELYNSLVKIHETGRLEKKEEVKDFLTSYIQLGIALGKFQEIIPVIVDKDMMFPEDKSTLLEKNLCYLMWPQSKSIFQAKEFQSGLNESISSSVLDYFEKEVKNNGAFEGSLQTYLSIWARDKVASPMIPYLYHILAKDAEITSGSNKQNGVQTTSPNGYIQTSSGLKYKITKAVYNSERKTHSS